MITYRVCDWDEGVALDGIDLPDHSKWALSVGFNAKLSRKASLSMMRKNVNVLLRFQARALRSGPAFVAPLKLEDFEALGGDTAGTVSRVFNGASISYQNEFFDPSYLVSPAAVEGLALSGIQVRCCCLVACGLTGDSASDQKVADLLDRAGVRLARRTITKYRSDPGLPMAVTPTARLRDQMHSALALVRDEGELARFVGGMLAHNANTTLVLDERPGLEHPLARAWERLELRDWLLEPRALSIPGRVGFGKIPSEKQVRVVDAMLNAMVSLVGVQNGSETSAP